MTAIILLGILTGLDNLQVTPALGVLKMTARRRLAWALTFGLAEALMPLIGLGLGHLLHRSFSHWADRIGPFALLICGVAIIVMALRKRDLEKMASSNWTLIGLPLALSLDNLFAGIGIGAGAGGGAPILVSAGVIGGISAIMALTGLYSGQLIRRWLPGTPELICGSYLMLLGGCGFFWSPIL